MRRGRSTRAAAAPPRSASAVVRQGHGLSLRSGLTSTEGTLEMERRERTCASAVRAWGDVRQIETPIRHGRLEFMFGWLRSRTDDLPRESRFRLQTVYVHLIVLTDVSFTFEYRGCMRLISFLVDFPLWIFMFLTRSRLMTRTKAIQWIGVIPSIFSSARTSRHGGPPLVACCHCWGQRDPPFHLPS